jgi:hypothetical protein
VLIVMEVFSTPQFSRLGPKKQINSIDNAEGHLEEKKKKKFSGL